MRRISPAVVVAVVLSLAGCGGGPKLARVSGVVTVDGQPYKNAIVSFQPIATPGSENAGMGSTALTDEQGRYTLMTIDGKSGAVVGKHKVRIQTKRDEPTSFVDPNVGSDDNPDAGNKKFKGNFDPIPLEWYSDSGGKEFTVPDGGTDKADFAIESAKPKKK